MDAITRETLRSYGEDVSVPGSIAVTVQRVRNAVNVHQEAEGYVILFTEADNEYTLADVCTSAADMLQECRAWLEVE